MSKIELKDCIVQQINTFEEKGKGEWAVGVTYGLGYMGKSPEFYGTRQIIIPAKDGEHAKKIVAQLTASKKFSITITF